MLEKKRIHEVSWERVCKAKEQGGLAIRKMQLRNNAIIDKLGWKVIIDRDSLVCKLPKNIFARDK